MELLAQTLGNSILGMAIVFAVLVILMGCIAIMSKLMKKSAPSEAAPAPVPAPAAAAPKPARGSCGEVKLFDVPDKTAAMLMAITADKMGAPLNTLRFISIKEVK